MSQIFITHSKEETQQVAADFAKTLKGGEVIALLGDIGAGKTTFTQGLVAMFGCEVRVKSPTFAVLHEYPIVGHATIRRVVHIDFYRFTSPEEVRALELASYERPDTVIVAEWPELAGEKMPRATHEIRLRGISESEREIIL
jgi:tRNA threonylcarbamoyladenosine biosynthesis protein TsaE